MFSLLGEAVSSFFAPEPAAPKPPEQAPAPAPDVEPWHPEGVADPAAAAAAFPQYVEPLDNEQIAAFTLAAESGSDPEAAITCLDTEQREAIAAQVEASGDPVPTGLMDPLEIEALHRRMQALSGEPVPDDMGGQRTDEAALAEHLEQTPVEQRSDLLRAYEAQSAPAPTAPEATPAVPTGLIDPEDLVGPALPPAEAPALTPEQAAAAAKKATEDSLAIVNDAVAQAKADEIAKIATSEEENDDGMFGDVFDGMKPDPVAKSLEGLPPEMRQKVLAKIGQREGDDALDAEQLEKVRAAEEKVTEDEAYAKKKAKQVDDAVALAEKAAAAEGNHAKAIENSLDGLSPKRREEALEKMSPEARAAAEEALENRKKRLEKLADRLEQAQHGKSATDCTDEAGIVAGLSGLSESEADELSEIYGERFKDGDDKPRDLKKDLKAEFGEDDKESKFISAVFNGDKEAADEMSVDLAVSYLEDEADAVINTDEDAMNDILRAHNKNPEAAKRIADAYRAKTGKELSAACEDVMDDLEFKEASANIEGDPRTANVAVLEQGNGERSERVIEDVEDEPGGLETLTKDYKEHTGQDLNDALADQLPEDKAEAVEAQVDAAQEKLTKERDARLDAEVKKLAEDPKAYAAAKAKAEEVAGKLDTALSKMHVIGNNTDVTDPLRGLSPAEVKLVMDAYAEKTASLDPEGKGKNLEEELQNKLQGKDLKVASAVLSGDKVLAAVAFVQQAADNTGTDVEGWKKSMETLESPEDRQRFLALMDKHQGGKDAYGKLVRSETSSYERDTLQAEAIVDDDVRAATLAQVEFTKNAYGGKIAGWQEGLGDELGGLVGESEEQRTKRRQGMRENDLLMKFSNLGGSEDAQLDAMSGLQNERQQQIFNDKVKQQTGKSTEEIVEEEMSDHHAEAGKKFARGEFEDAQAERMVAELDCYVDNREDAASKPFEEVRLKKEQLERIGKIPEGPEREKAIAEEKKQARESLLEKADAAAKNAGFDSYLGMLEAKGVTGADLEMAKERIADGKVSEATALFKAGDTVVGNLGKDSGKFYEVMQGKSPAEMKTLRADFEKKHPDLKFDDWVRSKATSAGEKRDFEIMLEGNYARMEPKDLAAKAADPDGQRALIKRVKDLEAAARGGAEDNPYDPIGNAKRKVGNAAGNLLADSIGNAGERLDGRVEAVKKLEAKLDAGEALSEEEQKELVTHMRYMSGDQAAYTDTKTSAVNTGAEVVGKVVEAGTVALTGNDTLGTAAGGLAKMEVKGTFDPGRYGADQMVADGIQVAADTAGSALGGTTKNPFGSALIEGGVGGLGELGNTRNWNDAGKLVDATARSVGSGAVTSVASAGVEELGGEGLATKIASATVEELASGDEGATFKSRLANVAKSVAEESLTDAAKDHHKKHHGDGAKKTDTPAKPDPAVSVHPIIDVDGDPTPVDSGVETHPIIDVDGDPTPVDNGVETHPIIDVDGDPTPVDNGVETHPIIDVDGDPTPVDNGVETHPIIDVGPAPDAAPDTVRDEDAAPDTVRDEDTAPDTVREPSPETRTDPTQEGPRTIDELAATAPELRQANPKDLATAKTKLASGEALSSREMQAVLDLAVDTARKGIEREGIDIQNNADLGGMCGPSQTRVVAVLQHILGDNAQVVQHASHPTQQAGSTERALPGKLQSLDASHSYTTIHLPDGRAFLVDPTFGQFAQNGQAVGDRLLAQGGGEVGADLMKHGFVELTPEVANEYGRALTGKDTDFTVDDFAQPSKNPEVRRETGRDKTAVQDAKQTYDSVAEVRDIDAPGPKDWAAQQQADANARPKVNAEQQAIYDRIQAEAREAKTPEDWARLRALEHAADLPVTMRIAGSDAQAALDVRRQQLDTGFHADGTPVTQADLDAFAEETARVAELDQQRADEHAADVEAERLAAETSYRERDEAFKRDHVVGNQRISVEGATIGVGAAGTQAAAANPKTHELDADGKPRYIGIGDQKGELWKNLPPQAPIGQPAASLDGGVPGLADLSQHPTSENARSGEVAAAVAKNRDSSGITTVEASGPLQPLHAPNAVYDQDGKLVSLGKLETVARVEVGKDEHGMPIYQDTVIEMGEVDINSGMGPARELSVDQPNKREQMTKRDQDDLTGRTAMAEAEKAVRDGRMTKAEYDATAERIRLERAMMSAEDALGLPNSSYDGQDVLVIGGGPTAKWAGDHALEGGANVTHTATMPRPQAGTQLATDLSAKEAEIRAALADPSSTPEKMARLREEHHAIVNQHISSEMADLRAFEAQAADASTSEDDRLAAKEQADALRRKLDPFMGSRVDRNEGSLNNDLIEHIQMDVARVEQTSDGKCLVTYVDGTQKIYDRVIPGIGANANEPGGLNKMLEKLPNKVRFEPIIENGRPVGLRSVPGGITVSGAAALGTTGRPPEEIARRMDPEVLRAYMRGVMDHATRDGVSHGSRGIVPGMENSADNPALVQVWKARTEAERQAALDAWLDQMLEDGASP